MSVFGQIKEVVQIFLAMMLFGENLTFKSGVGIAVSILASIYYRYVITSRKEAASLIKNKSEEEINLMADEDIDNQIEMIAADS
jgi:hypothetical protein